MLPNLTFYDGTSSCIQTIPKGSRLLIVGTGPGAMDVARLGLAHGITHVTAVSRGGRLSKVQPVTRDYTLKEEVDSLVLALESKAKAVFGGQLSLSEISKAFGGLMSGLNLKFSFTEFLQPPLDAALELETDILKAKSGGWNWQGLMLCIGLVTPRLWKLLPPQDQEYFHDHFESAWMTYRHAMPITTAEQVLFMLTCGYLQLGSISGEMHHDCNRYSLSINLRPGGQQLVTADYVVVATGPNYQCSAASENPLIRYLVTSGMAKAHPLGGFALDADSLRLKGQPNVHCMGALARGATFYVNAMPRLVDQARDIVSDLLDLS